MQLLERPLCLAGGGVEWIIRRKSQPFHPLAEAGDEAKISAQNLAQPIRLGRGEVIRIHLGRVYAISTGRAASKMPDLRVE